MSDLPRLGFIGVGLMGHGMAKNLLLAGYSLSILGNRNRAPVEDLVAQGAVEASDPRAVAEAADIILLCLPSSKQVEAVFAGERGLLAGLSTGQVVIDSTTADPVVTLALGATVRERGADFVDAALGRSAREAEAGTLSTYVGGDPATIERIRPVLSAYADTIVVCGGPGAGATCKLLNNSISMGMATLISETLAAGAVLGVDLMALADVLSAGGADGKVWRIMASWLRDGDDSFLRGTVNTVRKDLDTYARFAGDGGADVPIARSIAATLTQAVEAGHGERFVPVLPGILAGLQGSRIRDLD